MTNLYRTTLLIAAAVLASPALAEKPTASEIYALTKTATTSKEFTAIIEKCDAANGDVKNGIDDVNALKAWALSKRGQQRVDLALSIRNAGNMQQFEAVISAALADFNDSIAIDDEKWKPYFGRATALANQDNVEKAILDLNRAVKLNPKSKKAKFNRAELLSWQKEFDAAIADYDVVIEADADDVQAINGLAFAKLHSGKKIDAIKLFDRVVELQPDNATAYQNRAEAHQAAGNWKLAHDDLTNSITRKATGDGYLKTAWLLSTCPDPDFFQPLNAMKLAKKGQSFNKDSVESLEVMAAVSAANGKFEAAVKLQEKAISKVSTAHQLRMDEEAMKVRLATYESDEVYLQDK